MYFTIAQKIAIASAVISIINADHEITVEEHQQYNHLAKTFHITEDMHTAALGLSLTHACGIISRLKDNQKRYAGKLLADFVDCDGDDDDIEIQVFNTICIVSGIEQAFDD